MKDYKSLSHTRWDCKYHVVFIPKKRKKVIDGNLRNYLGEILHELAKQKGIEIVEGHLMRDHVSYVFEYSPKNCCIECCRIFEREECHSNYQEI